MDAKDKENSNFPAIGVWDKNVEASIIHNSIVVASQNLLISLTRGDNWNSRGSWSFTSQVSRKTLPQFDVASWLFRNWLSFLTNSCVFEFQMVPEESPVTLDNYGSGLPERQVISPHNVKPPFSVSEITKTIHQQEMDPRQEG